MLVIKKKETKISLGSRSRTEPKIQLPIIQGLDSTSRINNSSPLYVNYVLFFYHVSQQEIMFSDSVRSTQYSLVFRINERRTFLFGVCTL